MGFPEEENTSFNNEPQGEEAIAPPIDAPISEDQPVVDDIDALRAKLAELEARLQQAPEQPQSQVKVEYRMPEEVRELLDNPQVLSILTEDYTRKSVVDLIKDAFRESNPWAKTDRHIEAHLKRQYPDIDFDIPENLGLAEEDYDAIA